MGSEMCIRDRRGVLEIECDKIETTEQLREYLRECSAGAELAIALNIKGEHQLDLKLEGLALCAKPERSIYLDLSQSVAPQNKMIAEVKKMLESATNPKIFHGLKKAAQLFANIGIELKGIESDVMLAAHLADPLARRYDLEYLLGRKLNLRRKT